MAEPETPPQTWWERLAVWGTEGQEILGTAFGLALGALVAGSIFSNFLDDVAWLKGSWLAKSPMVVLPVAAAAYSISVSVAELLRRRQAKRRSQRVDAELDRLTRATGTGTVAEVRNDDVVAAFGASGQAKEEIERLVEQRKQSRLVDDAKFRDEVGTLIGDFLQPLPRNAKRVMNRFRVNLLIAHKRGLLSTEPKVQPKQIGKWLVLGERWPQLARALAAIPERISALERDARQSSLKPDHSDPFSAQIKALAPPYVGDEELRRFLSEEPLLDTALPRLVHYRIESTPRAQEPDAA